MTETSASSVVKIAQRSLFAALDEMERANIHYDQFVDCALAQIERQVEWLEKIDPAFGWRLLLRLRQRALIRGDDR